MIYHPAHGHFPFNIDFFFPFTNQEVDSLCLLPARVNYHPLCSWQQKSTSSREWLCTG